ncbi:putative oxidoreductase [Faunimonas pinastri]|uniref:Putative oxidoreductase n=1 Tax=Faunimonas pinastri TaxID=1855383 RepID=A0A1H8ZL46_9HYPH|nr:DoxX family protein [Faunimonas pinastri]SEP64448.1 putative oxidoreductase [Faunimonas pinastri]
MNNAFVAIRVSRDPVGVVHHWMEIPMDSLRAPLVLIGRILIAYIFVVSGWGKLTGYSATAAYMASHGVPGALLPLVILTELGGGLLIVFGLGTRVVAFLLAGFTILTALFFHNDMADQGQAINFMKNVAIAGGFLFLTAFGPCAWSLDSWIASRRRVGVRLGA